jgi:hypothetical protein
VKAKDFFRSIFTSIFTSAKLACTSGDQLGKNASPAEVEVVISLTSIPSRLSTLQLTIKSLLNQSVSFEKVVLWLHQDLKNDLPPALEKLQGKRFEIHYSATTEPHRKLVETLKIHPDRVIVTCDDDMMYPKDWLFRLLESWRHTPDDIVAHRCRKIRINNGEIMPYRTWRSETQGESSLITVPLGCGGVLFPPGSLDARVLDRDAYIRLSPNADDLWYKAMAMLKGTAMRKSRDPYPAPLQIIASQGISLRKKNIGDDQNRVQLLALAEEYNLTFEE